MITRTMQAILPELCKGFPIITITGPRQSGKTTLAKMAYPGYKYLDLENLITRRIANEDPAALINEPKAKYILDEFQYAPNILSFLKELVDINQIEGQFILTGSNQFSMMRDVSQSLAGRTAVLELLPFSSREAYPEGDLDLNTVIYRGFYPRLVAQQMNPGAFYDSYIQTYLQRDLRQLMNVQNIEAFGRFLSLCAGRTGGILNKVSLANDTGVDTKTVSNWLSVLQASYIIYLLPSWHGNVSKRLIKSPKLYFYDTGLACRLLQIRNADDLASHPLRGNLFETLIVCEALKFYYNRGIKPPLSYFRESNGTEVDLIVEKAGRVYPIEIKSAAMINHSFYSNLGKFRALVFGAGEGRLVYSGLQSWRDRTYRNVGWRDLYQELQMIEIGDER